MEILCFTEINISQANVCAYRADSMILSDRFGALASNTVTGDVDSFEAAPTA